MSDKKINVQADFLFCLLLIALLVVCFVAMIDYRPVTRRAPLVVMIPLAFMVLGETIRITKKLRALRRENSTRTLLPRLDPQKLAKASQILIWLIVLLVMIYFGGHLGGISLFLLIFLKFVSKEPWKISLGVSVGVTLGLYVLFEKILMIPLYRGTIYDAVSAWVWS
ncbi:MAG: tripartite tricarboxylate transporter TctB family protein [Deltaproteobacteria bacterium]|nr:tripartite tricarboxylate transporter TctB family protein [Deltaproteobacteria bacterium]MBW2479133.1 tripartite tricarboxylate transporter TctB family protein [Deltaproteobacteria bacterium]